MNTRQKGFSLIEMSLVLVIIGVLFSAFLTPLQGYMQHKKAFEACEETSRIRQALLDFAVVHGRLPFAALSNGREVTGKEQGLLPWQTLSLRPQTIWGESYQYHVLRNWADDQPDPAIVDRCDSKDTLNHLSINFCSQGRLRVRRHDKQLLYDKAVVLITQPRAVSDNPPICEPGLTWLGAETVLGYLVMAGRLY